MAGRKKDPYKSRYAFQGIFTSHPQGKKYEDPLYGGAEYCGDRRTDPLGISVTEWCICLGGCSNAGWR